jgi:hypothetical protein
MSLASNMVRLNMKRVIVGVIGATVLIGCKDNKPVTVTNVPTKQTLEMRYDEKTHVLKLSTKHKTALEFNLPKPEDQTKVKNAVEDYDFSFSLVNKYDDWAKMFAGKRSETPSAQCSELVWNGAKAPDGKSFSARQTRDGQLVGELKKAEKILMKITAERTSNPDFCIERFNPEEDNGKTASIFNVLNQGLLSAIAKTESREMMTPSPTSLQVDDPIVS